MTSFDNIEFEKYKVEAQQNWGDTGVYKEYTKKQRITVRVNGIVLPTK